MKFETIHILAAGNKYIRESWAQVILVVSILAFLIRIVVPSSGTITRGFGAYYTASRLILEARAELILYDDDAFRAEVERNTNHKASDIFWANPPTTALMFLPLAFFSPESARVLWTLFSGLCLILAIALLDGALIGSSLQRKPFYLITSGFLWSAPLADNFYFGQAYVLILLLYSLAIYAVRFRMDWLVGFCLAIALALKASGIPLLVLLAIQGRWRLLAYALLCFSALAIATLPLVGVSLWQTYLLHVVPDFINDPTISVTAYQTIPGFLHHLFIYHYLWNPDPIVNWPTFAVIANWLLMIALFLIAGTHSKHASLEWVFCIGLLLSALLVPAAEQHHYILLFPAFLFVAHAPNLPCVPLFIAVALLAIPLTYSSKELSQGWWSLFAYPRLYGGIILYFLLLIIPNEPRPNPLTPGR